ncbi:hypothetical protein SteCoe_4645 [Stentor coeruleus]|uniref:Uncharacterized protein n=1 Tax=Stentor coeruleus TaxID=5963 RepID=A0A1R2CU32_9CILI|nr:hypothetical protein SteCoe_4645 [Stentor coeruleus]
MSDNRRKNSSTPKRVFIKLNVESPQSNISPTALNSRKLSTDFTTCFSEESTFSNRPQSFMSPPKPLPKGKPPLSPNITSKFESPQKSIAKSLKFRELSKSFVLTRSKFLEKVMSENLKLGVST